MDRHDKNNKLKKYGQANQPTKRDGNNPRWSLKNLKNITFWMNLCVYILTVAGTTQSLYDYFTYGFCDHWIALLSIFNIVVLMNAHLKDIHKDYIRNYILNTDNNFNFIVIVLVSIALCNDGFIP